MINWTAVEQWRDALRSGKYEQGQGVLRVGNRYCCLGVFCEAVAKIQPVKALNGFEPMYSYGGKTGALPKQALGKLQIKPQKFFKSRIFGFSFAKLNDEIYITALDGVIYEPLTFDEIADLLDIAIIEKDGIG